MAVGVAAEGWCAAQGHQALIFKLFAIELREFVMCDSRRALERVTFSPSSFLTFVSVKYGFFFLSFVLLSLGLQILSRNEC